MKEYHWGRGDTRQMKEDLSGVTSEWWPNWLRASGCPCQNAVLKGQKMWRLHCSNPIEQSHRPSASTHHTLLRKHPIQDTGLERIKNLCSDPIFFFCQGSNPSFCSGSWKHGVNPWTAREVCCSHLHQALLFTSLSLKFQVLTWK